MKHGRRHSKLKEQTHAARYRQDAPGYRREYDAIDVREPDKPATLPEPATTLSERIDGKAKRGLRRLGIPERDPE